MLELQGEAFGAMRQSYGGDTLNTAVYLARCGHAQGLQVSYATALGDDALSAGLMARWRAEGLVLDAVRTIAGRLPGLYQIAVDADGERRFSYWRNDSAARAYFDTAGGQTPLELQAAGIDAFYFSGISLAVLPPAGRLRLLALARRLRRRGALVAFDNNYRPRLWATASQARANFAAACAASSIAFMTLDDDMALHESSDESARLTALFALPCPEVVVKRGATSTLVRCLAQPLLEVAAVAVPKIVDTTAAGDSFAAAYLARRLAGGDAASAARAGNRLAARVIAHPGALIDAAAMADLLSAPGAL